MTHDSLAHPAPTLTPTLTPTPQVLRKLTQDAAKFLNDKVEKAVITVPAYFNDSQRQVCVGGGGARLSGSRGGC